MKKCEGSCEKLRSILDNIIPHYKDQHDNCLPESRCRTEEGYKLSKVVIQDEAAENILKKAIQGLQIYKNAKDYVYCLDTHYVESFNNMALVYHDKRIVFGYPEYQRRTDMAIIDWNNNVDQE